MFDKKDTLISQLRTPLNIASMALDEIEARLGGTQMISDPNTPFCHLLEFGSSITAAAINAVDEKFPTLYPQRAMSSEDLYTHMSDFDYVKMYSTPSSTMVRLSLPKQYLTVKALKYNDNYKKVTIPKETVFHLGNYTFGLYYPIDILINNYTNTFTAAYDISETNPLHTPTTNIVDKTDFKVRGIGYVSLLFPVYQFSRSTVEETLMASASFVKKWTYRDKFYACRIFMLNNGKYSELHQSQSKIIYDSTTPTALVRLYPDEHALKIVIPQIYFDKGLLHGKLVVDIYTTLGQLDINTTNISNSSIAVEYGFNKYQVSDYSQIFQNFPFDNILQIASDKIAGGSNPISFAELRNRVVNDTLYDKVPITEQEIANYLGDNGFYVKKYRDNVTSRIYNAYRVLADGNGSIIPSMSGQVSLSTSSIDQCSTFLDQADGSITVLPTTLYRLNESTNALEPLNDTEMRELYEMDKTQQVNALNNNRYFRYPYYLRLDLSDYYPSATSYDFMQPKVTNIRSIEENYNVAAKMATYEATAAPLDEGVSGFHFQLSVQYSDDLQPETNPNINRNYLKAYILTKDKNGSWVGIEATYAGELGVRGLYTFDLKSRYRVSDNYIGVTNLTGETTTQTESLIPFTADFYVVFLAYKSYLVGTYQAAPVAVSEGVPNAYFEDYVALSRHCISVTLGTSLTDVIRDNVEVSATSIEYATWDHDEPLLYEQDVYEKDATGKLATSTSDTGQLTLNKLHEAGEQQTNEAGEPLYAHRIGDLRLDANGQPIPVADREKLYYVDLILIDARVYASERAAETEFVAGMYDAISGYFDTIRTMQDQLLERTYLYFNVVRSTGTATFNYGDGVLGKDNIELSFRIICFVPSYVKQDSAIQTTIRNRVVTAIEAAIQTKTISMNEIFAEVQEKLSDYIDHFTLLGINGNVSNQTFKIVDDDAQPSIARKLELTEDNVISLVQDISIDFVALEDNMSGEVQVEA